MNNMKYLNLSIYVVLFSIATLSILVLPTLLCQYNRYELIRHTPGFPDTISANLSQVYESLMRVFEGREVNDQSVYQVQNVLDDLVSSGMMDKDVAEAAKGYATAAVDPYYEANLIKNPLLRRSLRDILYRWSYNEITYNDLLDFVNKLNTMYSYGEISYEDYLRSLKIARRLTELLQIDALTRAADSVVDPMIKGYLENVINMYNAEAIKSEDLVNYLKNALTIYSSSPRDYEILMKTIEELDTGNLLLHSLNSMWLEGVLNTVSSFEPIMAGSIQSSMSNLWARAEDIMPELSVRGSPSLLPSIKLPSVDLPRLGKPSVPTSTLIVIAFTAVFLVVAGILVKKGARIGVFLRNIPLLSKAAPRYVEEGENLPRVIKLYWGAVRFVESRLGVVKGISETHREFLSRVKPELKELSKAFEGITLAYELYRFGNETSEDIERLADEYYNALGARP